MSKIDSNFITTQEKTPINDNHNQGTQSQYKLGDSKLLYRTFKNAGHMVPEDVKKEAFEVMTKWISDQ